MTKPLPRYLEGLYQISPATSLLELALDHRAHRREVDGVELGMVDVLRELDEIKAEIHAMREPETDRPEEPFQRSFP